jgi:hypothetical protein
MAYLKSFWPERWLDMQPTWVISSSSHDLIATDCHLQIKLRIAALPWHTWRPRYVQMIWMPVDFTALTETLKQCRMCWAGAAASGIVSSSTVAFGARLARTSFPLMDREDIPRQCSSSHAFGLWGKAVRGRLASVICTMPQRCARRAWPVSDQPALVKMALFSRSACHITMLSAYTRHSGLSTGAWEQNNVGPGFRTGCFWSSGPGLNKCVLRPCLGKLTAIQCI